MNEWDRQREEQYVEDVRRMRKEYDDEYHMMLFKRDVERDLEKLPEYPRRNYYTLGDALFALMLFVVLLLPLVGLALLIASVL